MNRGSRTTQKTCICGKTHRKISERQCLTSKGELERVLKLACRMRDQDACQHCGKHIEGTDCHLSHVIPRPRCGRLPYALRNVKLLCFHCHIQFWHEHPLESAEWFKERFPDRLEYLETQLVVNRCLGTIPIDWYRNRYIELLDYIAEHDPERMFQKVGKPTIHRYSE